MSERQFKVLKSEHDVVSERLSPYVDEQLSPAEVQRVEAHLGTCQRCREDLRTLRWTKRLLQEIPTLRTPRSFVIREADVAARRPARSRRPVYAMQWAAALAAVLFVLVLAGDLFTGRWLAGVPGQPVAYELAVEEARPVEVEATVLVERGAEAQEVEVTVEVEKEVVVQEAPPKPAEEGLAAQPMPTPVGATPPGPDALGEAPRAETPATVAGTPEEGKAEGIRAFRVTAEQEKKVELEAPPSATASPPTLEAATDLAPTETPEPSPEQIAKQLVDTATMLPDQAMDESPAQGARVQARDEMEARLLSVARSRWGWRGAEVGLGLALLVLVLGTIWMRRRK